MIIKLRIPNGKVKLRKNLQGAEESKMKFNLAFIGFGTVGQGLAKILVDKEELLKRKYNFEYNVVAVSDIKKGSVYNENGLNLKKLLQLVQQTGKIEDYEDGQRGFQASR